MSFLSIQNELNSSNWQMHWCLDNNNNNNKIFISHIDMAMVKLWIVLKAGKFLYP